MKPPPGVGCRLYRPAPSRCVCWLCVCRGRRVRGRRVGVSACRRVGVCVGVLVCWFASPDIPFFSKKKLYTEQHHHTQGRLSCDMMDFCRGVWVVFFVFFRDMMTRAPARPLARPNWTPALKPAWPPRLRRRTPFARAEILEPAWPARLARPPGPPKVESGLAWPA